MIATRLGKIAEYCGGTLLFGDPEAEASSVAIDSRAVEKGGLFVPLVGEKTDAHRFLKAVEEQGAAVSLVNEGNAFAKSCLLDRRNASGGMALISVKDTREALQRLASSFRSRLTLPLVGVTGSVGKTTTREMIGEALSASFRVYRTPGNSNSQVGVPITLLNLDPEADIAVIEMGMSLPGEMERLARIVRPDAAVFTNIGVAHIEQLGSKEAILREKLHITDCMPEGAPVFVNGTDPLLLSAEVREGLRKVRCGADENSGRKEPYIYAEHVSLQDGQASFTAVRGERKVPMRLHVYGTHMIQNALTALAVTEWFGGDMDAAADRLSSFRGFKHRQQIFWHGGITVVDDSYNASPDSMKAALRVLSSIRPGGSGKRYAVLADMLELGENAPAMHREVGRLLSEERLADTLFTLGELSEEIADGALAVSPDLPVRRFRTAEELTDALQSCLRPGDAVLFKGSNSMGLSRIADRFSGNTPEPGTER